MRFEQERTEVSVQLAEKPESVNAAKWTAYINEHVDLLRPLTESEILVRSMFVVSDQINSYGGRFPADELDHLLDLLIDSPVLVGHRTDSLPIARTFFAEKVMRDGRPWIKCYFYWLASADGAGTLAANIDGGIYRECSIGFMYGHPECSICGEDIRSCRHEPFACYGTHNGEETCHFNYRDIKKVLETSLVYRGAHPGTGMAGALSEGERGSVGEQSTTGHPPISGPAESANKRYLVVPWYDAIPVTIEPNAAVRLRRSQNGEPLDDHALGVPVNAVEANGLLHAQLLGYRGKERLTNDQLEATLAGGGAEGRHFELRIMPEPNSFLSASERVLSEQLPRHVRPIRYRIAAACELAATARLLKTKEGVRVWPLAHYEPSNGGLRVRFKSGHLVRHDTGEPLLVDADPCATRAHAAGGTREKKELEPFGPRHAQYSEKARGQSSHSHGMAHARLSKANAHTGRKSYSRVDMSGSAFPTGNAGSVGWGERMKDAEKAANSNAADVVTRLLTAADRIAESKCEQGALNELSQDLHLAAGLLAQHEELAHEHALLRREFEGRVRGMIKALVALDRSGRRHDERAELLERLSLCSSEELIRCSALVSAQFREQFPASYGLLRPVVTSQDRHRRTTAT